MKATRIEVDGDEFLVVLTKERWEGSTKPYLEAVCSEVVVGEEVELREGDSFMTDDVLSDLLAARDD